MKKHRDRCEVLLDRGRGSGMLLDVSGDEDRVDVLELADPALFASAEEQRNRADIRSSRVAVPDIDSKKLDEAPGGFLARAGDC